MIHSTTDAGMDIIHIELGIIQLLLSGWSLLQVGYLRSKHIFDMSQPRYTAVILAEQQPRPSVISS